MVAPNAFCRWCAMTHLPVGIVSRTSSLTFGRPVAGCLTASSAFGSSDAPAPRVGVKPGSIG